MFGRTRIFLRETAKHELDAHEVHPQREALERTLDRVVREAEQRVNANGDRQTTRGVAIFACEALGLWRVVEFQHNPLSNRLCTGMRPQLLPLARLFDDVEPALVAMVHAPGAHIYEVALGGIVSETKIEGFTPVRHGQGGRVRAGASPSPHGSSGGAFYEREDKNKRHIENFLERNRRDAADALVKLFDGDPRAHVVLVGGTEMVAAFEKQLPERVASRIIAKLPRPPSKQGWSGEGKAGLVATVVEKIAEQERVQEQEIVESAIGQALRGGMAVLGTDDVILAVNERRVHRLILEEGFEGTGWMCRNCNAIGNTHPEKCTYCNGELAWVKELGEELASRVLADDGHVEVVPQHPKLHAYKGVAATLRQAVASRGLGTSEASAPMA